MAGDWIKMRLDLQSHPKIVRIMSATKTDKFRVVGGLHAMWSVFDAHSSDGRLDGYTPDALDQIIGWTGFAAAVIAVGWLAFDGLETLILPEFDEHNGKSGKRRAEDQKRKREDRKSPQSVRNLSADDAEENRTREEKRREENKDIKPRAERATRLPPDWTPDDAYVEFCQTERPDLSPGVVASRFRDYWIAQPGAKGRKTDWLATWRNWVRNENRIHDPRASPQQSMKFDPVAHVNRNRRQP